MKRLPKKLLSLLLALTLAAGALPAALPAAAAKETAEPLIYVPDYSEIALYYNNGSVLYEVLNVGGQSFTRVLSELLLGFIVAGEDLNNGVSRVCDAIDRLFSQLACGTDGKPLFDEVGITQPSVKPSSVSPAAPIRSENIQALFGAQNAPDPDAFYIFYYDWRLSPIENASLLDEYVESVRAANGGAAVSLLTAGYGGIVAETYLAEYPAQARQALRRCVFLDPFVFGSTVIGDLMAGRFHRFAASTAATDDPFQILKPDDGVRNSMLKNAITKYVSEDPNGAVAKAVTGVMNNDAYVSFLSSALLALVSTILSDEGVYGAVAAGVRRCAAEAAETIYGAGLRDYLRCMPGLWAMVPDEDYDEAGAFLFGEDVAPALKRQLDEYRLIRKNAAAALQDRSEEGIQIAVVSGYSRQILPITAGLNDQSDGLVPTRLSSLGAATPDSTDGETAVKNCRLTRHRHDSPDGLIDASTCALPEQTWFIKNHRHLDFVDETAGAFLAFLLTAEKQPTVLDDPLYPQFMQRSAVSLEISPIPRPDSPFAFLYGDLNEDKQITADDARTVLRIAVGLEYPSRIMAIAADVDNDDQITAADARLVLRYAVGLEKAFPIDLI